MRASQRQTGIVAPPVARGYAVPFADIPARRARWTWLNRIPVGFVTILAAEGGTGKGVWGYDFAARKSRGWAIPGEANAPFDYSLKVKTGPARNVIIFSSEDDARVVISSRLVAAGADMERVFFFSIGDGEEFEMPKHAQALRDVIEAVGNVGLVFIDPLAGITQNSLASVARVRAILKPLSEMATQYETSIVVTHHLTKGGIVAGSRAVIDAVRSVLMIKRLSADRDSPDYQIRQITIFKTNMGNDQAEPIDYTITQDKSGQAVVEYLNPDEFDPRKDFTTWGAKLGNDQSRPHTMPRSLGASVRRHTKRK